MVTGVSDSLRGIFDLFDQFDTSQFGDLDTRQDARRGRNAGDDDGNSNPFLSNSAGNLFGGFLDDIFATAGVASDAVASQGRLNLANAQSNANALNAFDYLNLANTDAQNQLDVSRQALVGDLNASASATEAGILAQINAEKKKNAEFYIAITKLDNTWARVKRAIQSLKW